MIPTIVLENGRALAAGEDLTRVDALTKCCSQPRFQNGKHVVSLKTRNRCEDEYL